MDIEMIDNDFLQPLLDMMNRRMDTLEQKIDANTATTSEVLDQARYTNGRVTKAEETISRLETRGFKKLDLNPNTIYLLAIGAVLFLAIIASVLHVNVKGLL